MNTRDGRVRSPVVGIRLRPVRLVSVDLGLSYICMAGRVRHCLATVQEESERLGQLCPLDLAIFPDKQSCEESLVDLPLHGIGCAAVGLLTVAGRAQCCG